jgi:Fic family protein
MAYQPPFTPTPRLFALATEIGEYLGVWSAASETRLTPMLRRGNRIRTIQASLQIEQNTLSVEQVSAVIEGKPVWGPLREIQEVKNAFATYERLESWSPYNESDLLYAHGLLMAALIDDAGVYRRGGVGIFQGEQLIHLAPPAARVAGLMADLLHWAERTDLPPLLASCLFHYEFEFIHPFSDGNGRMGRFWQTLMLSKWRPLLAWLPVETVVRDRQADYYAALARSDAQAEGSLFVEFMLEAIRDALRGSTTDQVDDQVSDQVQALLAQMDRHFCSASELMRRLGLSHKPTFRNNYLNPALELGLIEMSAPDSPRSPQQKYRRR